MKNIRYNLKKQRGLNMSAMDEAYQSVANQSYTNTVSVGGGGGSSRESGGGSSSGSITAPSRGGGHGAPSTVESTAGASSTVSSSGEDRQKDESVRRVQEFGNIVDSDSNKSTENPKIETKTEEKEKVIQEPEVHHGLSLKDLEQDIQNSFSVLKNYNDPSAMNRTISGDTGNIVVDGQVSGQENLTMSETTKAFGPGASVASARAILRSGITNVYEDGTNERKQYTGDTNDGLHGDEVQKTLEEQKEQLEKFEEELKELLELEEEEILKLEEEMLKELKLLEQEELEKFEEELRKFNEELLESKESVDLNNKIEEGIFTKEVIGQLVN